MEKLIEKFLEIFPDVSREAAEGSVINIVNAVGNNEEVAIPEGKEEAMNELIAMAKEHIEAERSSTVPEASESEAQHEAPQETSGEVTSEAEPTLE